MSTMQGAHVHWWVDWYEGRVLCLHCGANEPRVDAHDGQPIDGMTDAG